LYTVYDIDLWFNTAHYSKLTDEICPMLGPMSKHSRRHKTHSQGKSQNGSKNLD